MDISLWKYQGFASETITCCDRSVLGSSFIHSCSVGKVLRSSFWRFSHTYITHWDWTSVSYQTNKLFLESCSGLSRLGGGWQLALPQVLEIDFVLCCKWRIMHHSFTDLKGKEYIRKIHLGIESGKCMRLLWLIEDQMGYLVLDHLQRLNLKVYTGFSMLTLVYTHSWTYWKYWKVKKKLILSFKLELLFFKLLT